MLVQDLFGRDFASRDAGVVDQDVDPAGAGHEGVGGGGDLVRPGDVEDDPVDGVALGGQIALGAAQRVAVQIGDGDHRARLGESGDAGQADAARPAGDQGDTAVQSHAFEVHPSLRAAAGMVRREYPDR